MNPSSDPSKIMQIGMGFWASKVLLAAVEFDLFTLLSNGAKDAHEIKSALNLHDRGLYDFLDTLTSLGFLKREGILETAKYSNAQDVDTFLVKGKPPYLGGMMQMANHRLYPFWGSLEEALRTGEPQNESKGSGDSLFEALYADHDRLEEFLKAMSSVQMGNFMAFSKGFDFTPFKTCCDMGGAGGYLSMMIAQHNSHMSCISFDLPPVEPIATKNILQQNLDNQVKAKSGDFFKDQFPSADMITMSNILHDWDEEQKIFLMHKAYEALNDDGVFVVIENVIDDERKENSFGLLMSLNMLIETDSGSDYTKKQFDKWATEAGFSRTSLMPLAGPASAIIAYK